MPKFLLSGLLIAMMAMLTTNTQVCAAEAGDVTLLEAALADLDGWIGDGANGQKWRKFLASEKLLEFIAEGEAADPAKVVRVLEKYRSGASGLEKARFVKVRQELENWIRALRGQYSNDLPKMAWASRGDYDSSSMAGRLSALQKELKEQTQELEKQLSADSTLAENWKQYLRWELLRPHFEENLKVSDELLVDLDRVLRRFRSNQAGLEMPVFLDVTEALVNYRAAYAWHNTVQHAGARSKKKYPPEELQQRVYHVLLLGLQRTLTQHQEVATVETSRQIGETLGVLEQLGQSPQLVTALRSAYSQPNVKTQVSEAALDRFASRPVDETQPVRDMILGARIRGTAHSIGQVGVATLPADDHIGLQVQIRGNIHSNTKGYKKPVIVTSQGTTSFFATKEVLIDDDQFLMFAACTSADTDNTVCDICKTGGNFGRRLVEKIAWKKVRESQGQSEAIAARHAEQKVSAKFDKQISPLIFEAREKYDTKVRAPMIRIGMSPEELAFSSTDHSVNLQTKLASFEQLSTNSPAVELDSDGDFSLKVHETAINNFLPNLLGGLIVQQQTETEPPQVEGDVPTWLKQMAEQKNMEREAASKPQATTEETSQEEQETGEEIAQFKPFSIELNRAYPMSVSLHDQKFTVRIRVAKMTTFENGEETLRTDWDFVVTYAIEQVGNGVKLRREGEVETFPTGFDPQWDKKLSSEQVATRGALSKILNKRTAQGKGFPEEIDLPQVEIAKQDGTKIVPNLQHLYCDEGWLALSYQLP